MIWRDKTLGRIFEKVAKEYDLPPADVRELFEKYFDYGRQCIADDRLPEVNFLGFGSIIPMKARTEQYIQGMIERETLESVPELQRALERIVKEKKKRKRNEHTTRGE